jgi:hypothetical protein
MAGLSDDKQENPTRVSALPAITWVPSPIQHLFDLEISFTTLEPLRKRSNRNHAPIA